MFPQPRGLLHLGLSCVEWGHKCHSVPQGFLLLDLVSKGNVEDSDRYLLLSLDQGPSYVELSEVIGLQTRFFQAKNHSHGTPLIALIPLSHIVLVTGHHKMG
jgi:hypothetical protein